MRTRLLILPLLVLLAGCAGRTKTTYEVAGADPATLRAGGLGVGGVVLGARLAADPRMSVPEAVPMDDPLAQCDELAPVLFRNLLVQAEGATVWSWPVVRDDQPDSALAPVLAAVGRGAVLTPARLAVLAPEAGGVRFLACARIDGNEISLHGGEGDLTDPNVRRDDEDVHESRRAAFTKTRREVTVVLDVYDLTTGKVVRSLHSRRVRERLLDAHEAMLVSEQQAGSLIADTSARVPAPPFEAVFEDACRGLAQELLPSTPRSRDVGGK